MVRNMGIARDLGYLKVDDSDLVEYRDMITIIRDNIQELIKRGMTVDQVKKADPARAYRRRYGSDSGAWTTDMFVEAVYTSLKQSLAKTVAR